MPGRRPNGPDGFTRSGRIYQGLPATRIPIPYRPLAININPRCRLWALLVPSGAVLSVRRRLSSAGLAESLAALSFVSEHWSQLLPLRIRVSPQLGG